VKPRDGRGIWIGLAAFPYATRLLADQRESACHDVPTFGATAIEELTVSKFPFRAQVILRENLRGALELFGRNALARNTIEHRG